MADNNLKDLENKIKQAKQQTEDNNLQNKSEVRHANQGMKIASEIIMSPVAGGLLGFLLDKQFETLPLFLLIFVFLGMAVGIYRAYTME